MAVPRRGEGMREDDENDVQDGLLEEDDALIDDDDSDVPPHYRDICAAAQYGQLSALSLALEKLNHIDEPVEDGDTALHLTSLYGHASCVQLVLEKGASLEVKDEDNAIPLHDACAGGYTEVVQILINSATDQECVKRMLDAVDMEDDTPLHHAARGQHSDVIRILLSHGASLTTKNIYQMTPIELTDPGSDAKRVLEGAMSSIPL